MCGEALPRRALSKRKWARPLVRPLAHEYWGKSPNRGHSPSLMRNHRRGKASPHIRRQSRSKKTFEASKPNETSLQVQQPDVASRGEDRVVEKLSIGRNIDTANLIFASREHLVHSLRLHIADINFVVEKEDKASAVGEPHYSTAKLSELLVLICLKGKARNDWWWTTQTADHSLSIGRPVPGNKPLVIGRRRKPLQVLIRPGFVHIDNRVYEVGAKRYLRAVRGPQRKARVANGVESELAKIGGVGVLYPDFVATITIGCKGDSLSVR